MITFGEMVAETAAHLRSFVRDQEISTHIHPDEVGEGDETIKVADASAVSRGRIEIDDELIWVDKSDKDANTLTIPPYGRGMDGTKAMAHAAGTRVIVSPLYPRSFIKSTLNQTIRQIGSQLYGVESLQCATLSDGNFKYILPGYTRDVLTVTVNDPDFADQVRYLRDWTFDKSAPSGVSDTGKALYVYDDWTGGGLEMRVTISRDPVTLDADSDTFLDTYLPESAQDLPVLGAASRLLSTADAFDVQSRSVEANTLAMQTRGSNPAQDQSKYLQALFIQRLSEERMKLLNTWETRARYQR